MTVTIHTSIHGSTRTIVTPLAVASIKYNILGTHFFGNLDKTVNIEQLSLTFKSPHESHVKTLPLNAHTKNFEYLDSFYT